MLIVEQERLCFSSLVRLTIKINQERIFYLTQSIFFHAVESRKSLHLRLGLPFDRPLLRIANALNLFTIDGARSVQKGNQYPFTYITFCEVFLRILFLMRFCFRW